MLLTEAREIVRYFARNAADDTTSYSSTDVDRAIQLVGDDYLFHTRSVLATDAVNLYEDDPDFLTLPTGFSPDRLVKFWITEECVLQIVALDQIINYQAADGSDDIATGLPLYAAFDTRTVASGIPETTGSVYPTPDDDYTAWLLWSVPLTSFTAGTASPDAVSLNIPNTHLRQILMLGGSATLQRNQIEHVSIAQRNWEEYERYRTRMTGKTLGAKSFTRMLED